MSADLQLIRQATAALQDETASADERIKRAQAMLHWSRSPPTSLLTPRQHQVLQLIGCGLSNKLIARSMGISPETVKSHAKKILQKLNAQTRAEAILVASGSKLLQS